MPIYDYKCLRCQTVKQDHYKRMLDNAPVCCGEGMQQIYNTKIEVYDASLVFEHIGPSPMKFRDKRQLRQYCRQNGMTSHYAE